MKGIALAKRELPSATQELDAKILRYLGEIAVMPADGGPRTLRGICVAIGELKAKDSTAVGVNYRRYMTVSQRLQALKMRGLVRQESRRWWFLTGRDT